MSQFIDNLIRRIRDLQGELKDELKKKRNESVFIIVEKRIRFAEKAAQQRRQKIGWFCYLIKAAHVHYLRFFEYADAESWKKGLEILRQQHPRPE